MSRPTIPCPRCRGTGEVVARSRHVGGGAVNDDYDTCPRCDGSGIVPAPQPGKAERVEVAP